MEFRKRQWGTTTHACIIYPKPQMLAASMDITKTTSSSPEAGQGDLHLATHSAVFYFSFQIAFKEEIKLKIQENAYSS